MRQRIEVAGYAATFRLSSEKIGGHNGRGCAISSRSNGRGPTAYGLKPYREHGQRYSSVMLRAPRTFQEGTLWPEFLALAEELHAHLQELTERVIREAINPDVSEASEVSGKLLGGVGST